MPERIEAVGARRASASDFRYDAFISYRHIEPDRTWAKWLHGALETYRVPKRLAKERNVPARLGRVFRDEEELSASADLSAAIGAALWQSRFLIVVCSRHTPESRWVEEEVRRFITMGRQDRILLLLVDGEPQEAFPRPLRSAGPGRAIEPLAVDVRAVMGRGAAHVTGHARRLAKLRLIATILGVRFDDLRQRDRARRRRRAGLWAAAGTVVVMAGVWVGLLVRQSRAVQRADTLYRQVEQEVAAADWSTAHLREMDALSADLTRLSPVRGADARRLAYAGLARYADGLVHKPELSRADVPRIEAGLALLSSGDPVAAEPIRRAWIDRQQRDWLPDEKLVAPFANLAAIFPADAIASADYVTVGTEGPPPAGDLGGRTNVTPTKAPSAGRLTIELSYRGNPSAAEPVGVVLNADPALKHISVEPQRSDDQSGYALLVRAGVLEIRRSGLVLAKAPIDPGVVHVMPAANGTVRLTASRVGQRLSVQVGDAPPLEFEDVFAPATGGGKVAVIGRVLKITRLIVSRQPQPPGASPLEKGDDLFAAGNYAAALAEYRRQQATAAGDDRLQAAYKAGLCLAAPGELGELENAAREFGQLVAARSDRWSGPAACQLAAVRLRQPGRDADAENVLVMALTAYPPQQLVAIVPEEVRTALRRHFLPEGTGAKVAAILSGDDRTLARLRTGVIMEEALSPHARELGTNWLVLVHAYDGRGESARAGEEARKFLEGRRLESQSEVAICALYASLLRRTGRLGEAREVLSRGLAEAPGRYGPVSQVLFIERARMHAAAGQWEEAERDVDAFFHINENERYSYFWWCQACLLQGFLRERRGDAIGAVEAWRRGVIRLDGSMDPERRTWTASQNNYQDQQLDQQQSGTTLLYGSILGGLSGQWRPSEGKHVINQMLNGLGGGAGALTDMVPPQPVYECWRTPRGKALARQIAFEELSFRDVMLQSFTLVGPEMAKSGTAPLTPEQDAIYTDLGQQAIALINEGPDRLQAMKAIGPFFLAAWRGGMTGMFGWDVVSGGLKDHSQLRGPLAYAFARHLAAKGMKNDAATLYKAAIADAPPVSALAKNAKAELARLTPPATQPVTRPVTRPATGPSTRPARMPAASTTAPVAKSGTSEKPPPHK
jgi:tetratricopeptide (TPR) repeat protein